MHTLVTAKVTMLIFFTCMYAQIAICALSNAVSYLTALWQQRVQSKQY